MNIMNILQAGIVAWGIGCGEDNIPGVYASVPEGVCWIDLAMSCQSGYWGLPAPSYWGFSASSCQTWLDGRLADLQTKVDAMANAHLLSGYSKAAVLAEGFTAQKALEQYSQCSIAWVIDHESYSEPHHSDSYSQPEPESEPGYPSATYPESESSAYPEPESEPYAEPESQAYPEPAPEPYAEPESNAYLEPESEPESYSEGEPYPHSEPEPESSPQSEYSQNAVTGLCTDPNQSFAVHPTNCQK